MTLKMNTCAICEQHAPCEDDHFPNPERRAGQFTWPLCRTCHDMTDRVGIKRWPIHMWAAFFSLFTQANRDQRLFLVAMFKIADEVVHAERAAERRNNQSNRTNTAHRRGPSPQNINYEDRVVACLREHGPMYRSTLQKLAYGKNQKILSAIRRLEERGLVQILQDGRIDIAGNEQQTLMNA